MLAVEYFPCHSEVRLAVAGPSRAKVSVMREHDVVHIAAKKSVPESIAEPLHYWHENVAGMVNLLSVCREEGIDRLLFSSSAAAYGLPDVESSARTHPVRRCPPTARPSWSASGCFMIVPPRSACGPSYCATSTSPVPEALQSLVTQEHGHVPLVAALAKGERPQVFGIDYPTPDGTCIRDYVHVADVARAHLSAATALNGGKSGETYNIGRGEGASVLEVLQVVGEVTGLDVTYDVAPRRPGHPARVVAAVDRIQEGLGFRARYGRRTWSAAPGTDGGCATRDPAHGRSPKSRGRVRRTTAVARRRCHRDTFWSRDHRLFDRKRTTDAGKVLAG